VQRFAQLLFHLFLSHSGLLVLAALDSTLFFLFPFGIDAAVIILAVRRPESRWLFPVLATAGSLAGTMVTFWMGEKLEEAGLERYVHSRRLDSVKGAVRKKGATALAMLGIVPPPFPFTAFVLASGALGIDAIRFLTVVTLVRIVRFGAETALAAHYGTTVLRWLNSDVVAEVVSGIILLAIVMSAISIYGLLRHRGGNRLKPGSPAAA